MPQTDQDRLAALGLSRADLERARAIVGQFKERMNALRSLGLEQEPRLEPRPAEEPRA